MALIASSTSSVIPHERELIDFATLNHQMVKYPVKNLTRDGLNTIEIDPGSDAFINLHKSRLIMTCRLKTRAGENLVYDANAPNYSDVSVINQFGHSVFRNFSIYTSNNKSQPIYTSVHGNYGLVNYIKALKRETVKPTRKRTDGFSADTDTGPVVTSLHAGNNGLLSRGQDYFGSRVVTYSSDLGIPLSDEDVLLPPGMKLYVEAEFANDALNILIPQQLPNQVADIFYQLEILSLEIDLSQSYLRPEAFLGYNDLLTTQDFTRFYTDHQIKVSDLQLIIIYCL